MDCHSCFAFSSMRREEVLLWNARCKRVTNVLQCFDDEHRCALMLRIGCAGTPER